MFMLKKTKITIAQPNLDRQPRRRRVAPKAIATTGKSDRERLEDIANYYRKWLKGKSVA